MRNLAGETKADLYILEELNKSGIEVVEGDKSEGEVPYTLTGKLGNWNFERAWYYWMANAKNRNGLPLEVALELHNRKYLAPGDEVETYGQIVRAEGNCGCPKPTRMVCSYHVDTQEGLNALASAIRALHNITSVENDPKRIKQLQEKFSALYVQWGTYQHQDDIEWLKKLPTIVYVNRTVTELDVAIKDRREVVSIAKKWKDNNHGHSGIAQHFFKDGQITGFNYGHFSGPGQVLNRGPEIDEKLRNHYEELKLLRPTAADSLELCMHELEIPGPEYTGRSDGSMSVKLSR